MSWGYLMGEGRLDGQRTKGIGTITKHHGAYVCKVSDGLTRLSLSNADLKGLKVHPWTESGAVKQQ
jgi:hypothetical protein